MQHTYQIEGMTCDGCAAKVKTALFKIPEITGAEINHSENKGVITMENHVDIKHLQEALSKAGNYTIQENGSHHHNSAAVKDEKTLWATYYPIILIFGLITGITMLIQTRNPGFDWMVWMHHFMAGFFIIFSFFKLLDLKGFAQGYRSYDIIAKVVPGYGYLYPFLELGMGIAFMMFWFPVFTYTFTFIIMGISMVGVIRSMVKKQDFQCACLGTVIDLPLGKVTLFEDGLMVAMAGGMLVYSLV